MMSAKNDDEFDVVCAITDVIDFLVNAVIDGKMREDHVRTFFKTKDVDFNKMFTIIMDYRKNDPRS